MNIDDALTAYRGELIASAQRWQKARARRRHRIALVTSALAVAGIIVGTAIAATGWLVGSPAPKSVKSDFGSYAPQLGFNPRPGRAVLVARDEAYKLYATTNKQGGICVLVVTPGYHPGPHGEGGDCGGPSSRRFWANARPAGTGSKGKLLLIGHAPTRSAASVRFTTPNGGSGTAKVGTSGFFIVHTAVPNSIMCRAPIQPAVWWKPTFTLLNRKGLQVGQETKTFKGGCLPRPIPVHASGSNNGQKQFRLQQGETGILIGARAGDRVFCHNAKHVIHLMVPTNARHGVHRRYQLTPSRPPLDLNVSSRRSGKVWGMCW